MNIFVGNLAFEATGADIRRLFEVFGEVTSIKLLMHKKGIKNRGFGFVEMPDDSKAQAAMSNLSGQDFMGRPLKLSPARPKPENIAEAVLPRKEKRHGFSPEGRNFFYEAGTRRDVGFKPEFPKPGTYKGGRRSRNYIARNPEARQDERVSSERRTEYNPMRWAKKPERTKPWHKPSAESKPWHKPRVESKPWEKDRTSVRPARRAEGAAKPWHKAGAEAKPWRKPRAGEYKPWERAKTGARPERKTESAAVKPWRKPRGEYKPWEKAKTGVRPASKSHGAKPWHKAERPRPKAGFRARKRV